MNEDDSYKTWPELESKLYLLEEELHLAQEELQAKEKEKEQRMIKRVALTQAEEYCMQLELFRLTNKVKFLLDKQIYLLKELRERLKRLNIWKDEMSKAGQTLSKADWLAAKARIDRELEEEEEKRKPIVSVKVCNEGALLQYDDGSARCKNVSSLGITDAHGSYRVGDNAVVIDGTSYSVDGLRSLPDLGTPNNVCLYDGCLVVKYPCGLYVAKDVSRLNIVSRSESISSGRIVLEGRTMTMEEFLRLPPWRQ